MITIEQIKILREKTGAGISDVKKALEENDGDVVKAEAWLEQKFGSAALKKADREIKAGLVEAYIHSNGRIGVLIEVGCETDFVAKNPQFKELAHDLAMHIAAMEPENIETVLTQPFIKNTAKTIEDILNEAIGKFGENIKIRRFIRFEL